MLTDSHAHLDFEAYQEDRAEVIKRCQEKAMRVINVGSQLATSTLAVELAQDYDWMYAAIGQHPIHVYDEPFDIDEYQKLIHNNKRIVAVGECGFDYYYIKETGKTLAELKDKQTVLFIKQIKLAAANNLPLMIHGRNGRNGENAYSDILDILQEHNCHRGQVHCFGGTWEEAQAFLKQGFYIGITGIVTFEKKAEELQQIAKQVPLDRLLIETDSPYLTPAPYRGQRNEPVFVEWVARRIATLRGISYDDVVKQTGQNSINLFKL